MIPVHDAVSKRRVPHRTSVSTKTAWRLSLRPLAAFENDPQLPDACRIRAGFLAIARPSATRHGRHRRDLDQPLRHGPVEERAQIGALQARCRQLALGLQPAQRGQDVDVPDFRERHRSPMLDTPVGAPHFLRRARRSGASPPSTCSLMKRSHAFSKVESAWSACSLVAPGALHVQRLSLQLSPLQRLLGLLSRLFPPSLPRIADHHHLAAAPSLRIHAAPQFQPVCAAAAAADAQPRPWSRDRNDRPDHASRRKLLVRLHLGVAEVKSHGRNLPLARVARSITNMMIHARIRATYSLDLLELFAI